MRKNLPNSFFFSETPLPQSSVRIEPPPLISAEPPLSVSTVTGPHTGLPERSRNSTLLIVRSSSNAWPIFSMAITLRKGRPLLAEPLATIMLLPGSGWETPEYKVCFCVAGKLRVNLLPLAETPSCQGLNASRLPPGTAFCERKLADFPSAEMSPAATENSAGPPLFPITPIRSPSFQ